MKKPLQDKLKIGILGTRGIPNRYGGFEQWAEQLSTGLVKKGCEVTVYNSHFHPYKRDAYQGVKIIHKWDPKKIGLASQFIYDLGCILDARKRKFDIIIQLGYTTSSIWGWLLPEKAKVIYNMDGMEWKRDKYKGLLTTFLKWAEKLAIKHSDVVIADSKPIKTYIDNKYHIQSVFLAYPALLFKSPNERILDQYHLIKEDYYLLIARFQPDNNLEMIIKGVFRADRSKKLVVIGDHQNRFGRYLTKKYHDNNIVFLGKLYDKVVLDNLRYFSALYFHGHSAGGTNPSLLEAMAASSVVCAHDNEFNRSVLESNAYYFKNENDIVNIINKSNEKSTNSDRIINNLNKLRSHYQLNDIIQGYYKLF